MSGFAGLRRRTRDHVFLYSQRQPPKCRKSRHYFVCVQSLICLSIRRNGESARTQSVVARQSLRRFETIPSPILEAQGLGLERAAKTNHCPMVQ
jgi:hypothetical protein